MYQNFTRVSLLALLCHVGLLAPPAANARDYHVSTRGDDTNPGTADLPLRTINHAASLAEAGDSVIVHAGIYRERVNPARGGESHDRRITYTAAPGEKVVIKGSEPINTWSKVEGGVWEVELPDTFFKDYNPFALKIEGAWLRYGASHTRGGVYLNGTPFHQKTSPEEIAASPLTWWAEASRGQTRIRANFGPADPNRELTEINARETLFFPETPRLKFISVSGFHFQHAAPNWAPPGTLQKGALGAHFGYGWLIENCIITDSRAIGISIGNLPGTGVKFPDRDSVGHHVIRNNIIQRCGQSGIAGHNGCMASEIVGNVIEDTNHLREFGGWETAALKFHHGVDMLIENNLIRGVYKAGEGGAFGIWIDVGTQGMRVSRNIVMTNMDAALYFEANHGPILVDHNIIIGGGVHQRSEAGIFVHNLFVDGPITFSYENFENDAKVKVGARTIPIFEPHSTRIVGQLPISLRNDRWFNNIFINRGLDGMPQAEGFLVDHNVYLGGARPAKWADEHRVQDEASARFEVESDAQGVKIRFNIPKAALDSSGPLITHDFIGKLPHTRQGIANRDGAPINVDVDHHGKPLRRPHPLPGPFASLRAGENEFVIWPPNP